MCFCCMNAYDKFLKAYNRARTTDNICTLTNYAITTAGIAATCSGAAAPVGLAITGGGVVVGAVTGAIFFASELKNVIPCKVCSAKIIISCNSRNLKTVISCKFHYKTLNLQAFCAILVPEEK